MDDKGSPFFMAAASISALLCRTISVCVSYSHSDEFFARSATSSSLSLSPSRVRSSFRACLLLVLCFATARSIDFSSAEAASIFEGRFREGARPKKRLKGPFPSTQCRASFARPGVISGGSLLAFEGSSLTEKSSGRAREKEETEWGGRSLPRCFESLPPAG